MICFQRIYMQILSIYQQNLCHIELLRDKPSPMQQFSNNIYQIQTNARNL